MPRPLIVSLLAAAVLVPSGTASADAPVLPAARGTVAARGAPALPAKITAAGWLVADADTGAVLAAHDARVRRLPASTLKILTAVTLLPRMSADTQVTVGRDATEIDGSKVGITAGMRYSVRELATQMLMASGNDATTALADAAGGRARTLELMAARARELGAYDTVPRDPAGLDAPGEASTPYDLAILGRAALATPQVRGYLTQRTAQVRGPKGSFQIQTHNLLLGSYPGTLGVKNGYTVAAKATYVGAARRDGHTLVVTLMSAAPNYGPDARALLDWGFAAEAAGASPVGSLDDLVSRTAVSAPTTAPATTAARPAAPAAAGPERPRWALPALVAVAAVICVTWLGAASARRRRPRGRRRA